MPLITSPLIQIQGPVGDLVFYKRHGRNFARRRPSLPENHFRQENYKHSLQNAIQFGGASRTASLISHQLRAQVGDALIPYAHNHLAAHLLKACKADRDRDPGAYPHNNRGRMLPCFSGASVAKALLRMRPGKAGHHLTPQTTVITNPDGSKTYRITGLPAIAQRMAKAKQKGATREMRIRLLLIRTQDILLDPSKESYTHPGHRNPIPQPAPSHWFDATLLTEAAPSPTGRDAGQASMNRGGAYHHLDIPAPDLPDLPDPKRGDHIVTYLIIEWRDRKGKRSPAQLKDHTSILPMEAIPLHPEDRKPKPPRPRRNPRRFRTARRLLRKPIRPDITPAQRLKAALTPILKE